MVSKADGQRRSTCPINAALEVLGDRWSLLIVRDMLFAGSDTYMDFLSAEEGIATNILANRLARLEAAGIVTSRADVADRRRSIYSLTAKGLALAPAVLELGRWGVEHEGGQSNANVEGYAADRDGFLEGLRAAANARP
jgi:DNA-binding HxlR family transcriptional regulator